MAFVCQSGLWHAGRPKEGAHEWCVLIFDVSHRQAGRRSRRSMAHLEIQPALRPGLRLGWPLRVRVRVRARDT